MPAKIELTIENGKLTIDVIAQSCRQTGFRREQGTGIVAAAQVIPMLCDGKHGNSISLFFGQFQLWQWLTAAN
ncbi:MAG: hypothetical protein ACSW8J_01925 [bacterium]